MLTKDCCKGNNYEQNLSLDFSDEPYLFVVIQTYKNFGSFLLFYIDFITRNVG